MTAQLSSSTKDGGDERQAGLTLKPPGSTYRVQLHAGFTFRDATRIVPYLAELGIGALYTSPFFKALPGSTHGYDVVDYGQLNPEIGDERDFAAMAAALRDRGMGLLVDFVPNHMGIAGGHNAWWQDVLENGQGSPYAGYFDIDWEPMQTAARGKIVLPVLGAHYGEVLERGELALTHEAGAFTVCYYELPLPVAPPTYPLILRRALPAIETGFAADDPALLEFQSIITAFERLPGQGETDAELVAERRREQIVAKRRLARVVEATPGIARGLDDALTEINGAPGDARSFDALDALLEAQSYRLSFWRVAAEEINYRRFFAINELAGLRQEEPEVFAASHGLLTRLAAAGAITGIRIDHPDGLWDPGAYCRDLQTALAAASDDRGTPPAAPFYVVVEKILEPGEELPGDWPVAGTVGYEFARVTTGLFIDGGNRKAFADLYHRFIGESIDFHTLVYQKKQLMMRVALASEVSVLTSALNRISEHDRHTRDFTWGNLRFALREIIASFPVYRSYARCDHESLRADDRRAIERATTLARRRNPASDPSVFEFVRDILLQRGVDRLSAEQRDERCRFRMKFQQLTGPVMAKGLEDTALYIDNRLVALNEVGGDPSRFGATVEEFHGQCLDRRKQWPHALLASSTHDTKRSEDVRARIAVLSEMPREWRAALNRWRRLNRKHKRRVEGAPAPGANDECLLYQTLLGAWPFGGELPDETFVERILTYVLKAAKEAQVATSWVNPDEAYEEALDHFIKAILDPGRGGAFLDDVQSLRRKVADVGMFNGLSQQLLKLTAPGAPDIYQGTELWDFSLVDPDNRRLVDFDRRMHLLKALGRKRPSRRLVDDLLTAREDGRIKLYLTARALAARREWPEVFANGAYVPLSAAGARSEHVVAFARRHGDEEIVVAVPRLIHGLTRGEGAPVGALWGETRLIAGDSRGEARYRALLTGEIVTARDGRLRLADVFAGFPVALLRRVNE